jgi:ubiquinone/menaquinone biosynthesis C-methylase UbiE
MFSLQELMRVLRNNGRLIVSSMKPFADLSQVYRDFVDQTENQEELEEARKLLSAAGRIKQKESAGIYTFFSEEELKQMFEKINAKNIEIARSFSNQSNLIVGEK